MTLRCLAFLLAVTAAVGMRAAEHGLAGQPQGEVGDSDALARRSGCRECHSVDKKVVGPAFKDVAAKYKQDAGARDTLIRKVKAGGKGNWIELTGGVPMPPHSGLLSDSEIAQLVDWVLGRSQ